MMEIKKPNRKQIMIIAAGLLFLLYVGTFIYINLTQYVWHVDSDMAAEALLAKEIWLSGSVIPPDWFASTECRILSTSLIGSLFYGMTGNMMLSMGLSCNVFILLIIAGYFYLTDRLHISWLSRLTGILLLFSFPANCILTEGGRLPYYTYLFFLFAGYYAPMCAFLFFVFGFYLSLVREPVKKKSGLAGGIVLLAVSFGLGCSGMRTAEMVLLPLFLADMVRLYRELDCFSRRPSRHEAFPALFLVLLLACNFIGMITPFSVEYITKFVSVEDIVSGFFNAVLPRFLASLGLTGGNELKSAGGFIQIGIYVISFVSVYGCVRIFREKGDEESKEKKAVLLFFLISLLLTTFILTVTMIGPSENYFFSAIFFIAFSCAFLTDWLEQKSSFLKYPLFVFICIYGLVNYQYTYVSALREPGQIEDWMDVADWMEENDYQYGYAEFWDANKLTLCSNGRVIVAPVTNIATIEPYLWLTNRRYYPPELPVEMNAAYIIRKDKQESFESTLDYHPGLEKSYENDRFVIYSGKVNYAIITPEIESKKGSQMAG